MSLLVCVDLMLGCSKAGETVAGGVGAAEVTRLDMSAGLTAEMLQGYVGKHVIVVGVWHEYGKAGPYVYTAASSKSEPVYILANGSRALAMLNELSAASNDNMPVEVAGVLRFYDPPAFSKPDDSRTAMSQPAAAMFYVDVEAARITFLNKLQSNP